MTRSRMLMLVALLLALSAFGLIAFTGVSKNLVYYWTPHDLRDPGTLAYGATIRLGGQVAPGSVHPLAGTSGVEFDITDHRDSVHVRSTGIPPQMFREGIGVVVEGTMVPGGYFQSDRLMVSHNNEYRAPKPGQNVNAKELIRTTNGVDTK